MKAVISLAFFALLGASSVYSQELRRGVSAKNAHAKVSDGFLPFTTDESIDEEDKGVIFPEDMNEEGEDEEGNNCKFPAGKKRAVGCKNRNKFYCKLEQGCAKKRGVQHGTCTKKDSGRTGGKAVRTCVCGCNGRSYCGSGNAARAKAAKKGTNIARSGRCSTDDEDFDSGDEDYDEDYDEDEDFEDEDSEDEDSEDEDSEDEDDGEDNKDAEEDESDSIDEQ